MPPQQPADPSNKPKPNQTAHKAGYGPGEGTVNALGIVLVAAYILLLTLFSTYLLIKIWPHCISTASAARSSAANANGQASEGGTPAGSQTSPRGQATSEAGPTGGSQANPPGQSPSGGGTTPANPPSQSPSGGGTTPANPPSQSPSGGGTTPGAPGTPPGQAPPPEARPASGSECTSSEPIEFFWGRKYSLWEEVRLLLIVLISGVLGGLLHAMRSLFWYVGQRDLRWSWVLMYVLMPFAAALLALAFYLVIRGGFFPMAKADESNPTGFAALALLVGLFSAQAAVKLKLIFETVFSPPPPGANSQPQAPVAPGPTAAPAPKVTGVSKDTGSIKGDEPVTITGTNFSEGATVQFGGVPATSVSFVDGTTLKVLTPGHAPGKVDIVVENPDGQSDTLPGAFTYN